MHISTIKVIQKRNKGKDTGDEKWVTVIGESDEVTKNNLKKFLPFEFLWSYRGVYTDLCISAKNILNILVMNTFNASIVTVSLGVNGLEVRIMADALVNYFRHLLRKALTELMVKTNSVKGSMNQNQQQVSCRYHFALLYFRLSSPIPWSFFYEGSFLLTLIPPCYWCYCYCRLVLIFSRNIWYFLHAILSRTKQWRNI